MSSKYKPELALREHILAGNKTTIIEAYLYFGVQNYGSALTRLRKDGFLIKSQRVTMAKIIRRANEYIVFKPTKSLPTREILVTEHWLSQ